MDRRSTPCATGTTVVADESFASCAANAVGIEIMSVSAGTMRAALMGHSSDGHGANLSHNARVEHRAAKILRALYPWRIRYNQSQA
jgi:hypothetical protein